MKTSCPSGKDIGNTLPISAKDTFFIVLENNVTVSTHPILSFYTAERENFVIRVSDKINRLRSILSGFSVVSSQIFKGNAQSPVVHHLVLSNRSFDTIEDVHAQLEGITYKEVKDFFISQRRKFPSRLTHGKNETFYKQSVGIMKHLRFVLQHIFVNPLYLGSDN